MRLAKLVSVFFLIIGIYSCDKPEESTNNYSNIFEIILPTDSPRGLAYDGDFLWYSDDSLNTINKISSNGNILETISITNCSLTGFEFHNNSIWCINDKTVLFDSCTRGDYEGAALALKGGADIKYSDDGNA